MEIMNIVKYMLGEWPSIDLFVCPFIYLFV